MNEKNKELAVRALLVEYEQINRHISFYTLAFKGLMAIYLCFLLAFMMGVVKAPMIFYIGIITGMYFIFLSYASFYVISLKIHRVGLLRIEDELSNLLGRSYMCFEKTVKAEMSRIGGNISPHLFPAFIAGIGALLSFAIAGYFIITGSTKMVIFTGFLCSVLMIAVAFLLYTKLVVRKIEIQYERNKNQYNKS